MRILHLAIATIAASAAAPSIAATTTLDFSGSICGPTADAACNNGSEIGQSYGDSAALDVGYRSIVNATNATYEPYLKYWNLDYGDLQAVVWGGADSANYRSEIRLTPTAGFEVALISLDAACYQNRGSCQTLNYNIRSAGGTAIAIGSTPTLYPNHTTLSLNSGYFSDGIVLQWGPDSYDAGLDNIALDVRAIVAGGVPEPTSWALMIGGFFVSGGMVRARRPRARVTA